mgnify:CR=1 FL=1
MYRIKTFPPNLLVKIIKENVGGSCRVEVQETKNCYEKGDKINIMKYELEKVSCELPTLKR